MLQREKFVKGTNGLANCDGRAMFNLGCNLFNRCDMVRRARSGVGSVPRRVPTGFAEAPQPQLIDDLPAPVEHGRIKAILETARSEGMLEVKSARISGRVSPALVARAKARTGLTSDSELIELALASLALDDDFMAVFERLEGTVDPDLPLGY